MALQRVLVAKLELFMDLLMEEIETKNSTDALGLQLKSHVNILLQNCVDGQCGFGNDLVTFWNVAKFYLHSLEL